ncbi:filamentous hemagglutinin N-terminal domain-containing protein [Microbulbifer sp. DLAB2-AA]|uniref:filamentous hemagglutinin N-terminal domain-containing protein n=1 Tax=Microbulbifer sp. DLAB2-AA TaxID=3243394 RepID=UPI00403A25B3
MKAQKNTLELKKLTSAIKVSRLAYAGMFAGLLSPLANAGPEGGVVTGGSGTIDVNGTTTTIDQNTDLLSIDWDSFSLSAEELVKFLQPNTSSVVLNRILDQSASTIHGAIEANGHVILVNPRGVLFTESATINVGAITASGLDMSPEDFMNGDFTFKGEDGSAGFVVNKGVINAASAVLVGKQVTNASSGLISAELVSLAAADEAILTFDADGMIGVQVTKEVMENDLGVDSAVLNEGNINGAQVLLEASVSGDLFTAAVNNEGTIKAQGIDTSGGKIRLFGSGSSVINSGELQAAGSTGGKVVLEGDTAEHRGEIDVRGSAGRGGQAMVLGDEVLVSGTIDARGTADGGEVLIGGDYQGKNDQIRNAKKTTVTEDALIDASGLGESDGGEVIVWADHTTNFAGTILAESGEQGGDGGFVETSGKTFLNLGENSLFVSTLSHENGNTGLWLLDPNWMKISSSNTGCNQGNCISAATIQTALLTNNFELKVDASDNITKGIRVEEDITWADVSDGPIHTLTLNSLGEIKVQSGVNISSAYGTLNIISSINSDGYGDFANYGNINVATFDARVKGDFKNLIDEDSGFLGSISAQKIFISTDKSFVNDGFIAFSGIEESPGVINSESFSLQVGQANNGSDNKLGDIQYTGTAPSDDVIFSVLGSTGTDKFTFSAASYDIALKGSKSFSLGTDGLGDNLSFTFNEVEVVDAGSNSSLTGQANIAESFTIEADADVVVDGITFTGIDRITDNGSDTDPADSLVSNLSSSDWSLTATDNQVTHSGITITGIESLSGGKKTLNGHVDAVNGDSGDSYTLASNGDVTVDRMTFATMEKIVAAGGSDTVEASGVSGISLLGSQSFSAAVTNGTTSTIIVEGIEKVTDTGEITGTSEADSFTVVKLNDDVVVQSQNIDFYGVNKVDGGDDSDTLTGLADTDFTLSDNSGGFSHSAIDFVNLENVTATGSSQLVGTTQQETYSVQSDGSVKVNGVNFAALSGVSAHADGLTGLDDIVDATLYSAGLALTGNVKEVKLLTTPDTNFVFSGIGQAQTQILDVSASGDVAIVAGDNALDIASINFTSLEEVNGGGSNTLKVAADVSLNNSSTAGDFDSSKMLFSGFNTVNSDSAITLTGTDAADEFTVGSAANQVAVEGITFTNVDVVAADAATGDKGESDIVNATAIDVYLTGNDKELSTNGMLFKEIETGNVTDKRLFGSATKSDSITILAANEITANAMGFIGISELDLGAGGGSVTGVDGADWQLTATNKQVISSGITFSNADILAAQNANLVGVAGRKEEFTLEDNSGIEVAVNEMTFTGIDRITDNGSDTDPADSLVSNLSSSDWSLTATDNQVTHSGITITGIESLSGGKKTLNGHVDAVNGDSGDSYTLASNGDVTVDRMTFATMEKIVAAGGSDTVEASGVSGISLLGSQSFSAAVTNGTTSTIIVEGIEKVTDTGEITGTSEADSFTVVKLNDDVVVQSQNIDFYGVSKVDGGDDSDTLTGLADTDFTLSDNSGGFSHSAIDFVNLENVTATGSSQLVGTTQQETYSVQSDGSVKVNGVNFAALSGVSAHADGLTGLDDIVDATLYSAGLALTGNVKEVKLLTTPDTNFVFSGIGQAQTQILDVSASGDVAIVAGDNALDIASINFTSLEEVNGGGSNTLKVAADVSLNNSSTAGDFDSSKMLFSGFNTVNSDSAITLTGTDAADEFTVGSAANQVAVEGITFTNVDVVAADAATGDKGESDIVNATAIDVYLTGNDKELSTNGMLFKEIETGNVTDKRLFGSATKSDSITILAANEITANAMGFIGISELDLGAGGGSVTGVDGADWQLTATNKQVISSGITFSNADILAAQNANLVGVAGRKEEFTLEDNSGIEVAVNEMTFTGIDRITDNGSDTDPADSLVSNLSSSDWSLTATDNQVTHSGITITGIESLSGGKKTLNGHVDAVNGDSGDSYTLASNGDVTVDRMTFATMEKIVAAGGSDTVEASGVSGISLLGSQSFSAAVTNGTTSTIIVEGIEKVTDTGEITGTSEADSFTVVKLNDDVVVQSQNIDFYGVNKVDGGDDSDTLTGLADTDFTLSDNSGGFSHSAIDFVNLENVTATGTGSSQLVGTTQQETYSVQSDGSVKVNGVNFAALSGVSAHADGLTGLDDIVDATLYSAGLALTGNVKEVKLLTTPDTNFVFSGIGQAQTQILDVSASGDVAIVAGDNALDIASINFTSLEEVNGGGSNTLKVAADVSLNNSSTAGDFDSSKMLFSGFNTVNSDSAITLTGTDAADEFTVGSAANQVAVEGITFTNVDVVAADAATGDKGESDIVNATAIDVYLTGNDKELSTNGMLFKEIETGNVTDKRLFGSATKSDSITILAANEITANAMGFIGISELDLGAGGGSVTGVDGADWQLTATNKQVISSGITFSNADILAAQNANLVGVAGRKEEFTLEDNSGIEVAVNEMTFTGIDRITDNGSDTDPADSLVSNLSSSDWSLTATDNQVTHSGITITGIESLSGGKKTLNGHVDAVNGDSGDSYTLASNGDVTVDRMTFATMEKIVAAGGSDTVEASGVSGISLLGSQSFSAAVTNGTTSTIIVEGIEKVTDTGEITGTSEADSFTVVKLNDDVVVQSQNIDFYGVSKVDGGDDSDTLTGLADTDFTLSDNSGGFSHSAIDFVNLENVTATGSSQLVGTTQQETYSVQSDGSVKVNGVNFAALSGVSAHADGLTGLDDIVDATLYSAGLALTGNVKEVKLLTTPDTNFVFSGIGQAQTQILDVSASGDVAIVAGDNALDIASINFTSLEEVNGGGSNTLKVAADVSLNNSSTAGDFDSSKMLFSGFNTVNSDSAITLTGTDAADEFTVGSAANQVAVEGITFTNVDVVAADAATGDKGESDIVNATAIDVYLTGNDKELSTNGMLFKEIETGNVTDKRLFGSATKSDSITILAANEITANAMGFIGISELDLGAGGGSVTGVDGADWQLTATNKQVISSGITFSNADILAAQNANLVGVAGRKEEFTLEDNSGIEVAVNEMTFTGIDRITDNGSDTDPADSLVSNLSSSDWSLTATDNQVTHSGITITGIESLSGGKKTLNGHVDAVNGDSGDSYTLASNGDVTVDRMTFATMEKIVAAGGSDTVEASGVSGISLLGSQSFSAAVTNGTTSTIIVEGIEKVTDTGEITGTSEADSFTVVKLNDDVVVQSQNIDFYGVSKVDGGDDSDTLTGLADTDFTLSDNSGGFSHSAIDFVNLENVTATGSSQLVGTTQQETYSVQSDGSVKVNGVNFAALSGVSAHADGLTGLDDIVDATLYSAGLALTGNVKEVKLLTTPDTNFVFSGIGQAQTQILDVSASGDVAIVAGDNALDIASINFTSLEEVNGGGSNTLKVAADVSLNNSSTAGDFDSSKMLFSGFNTVNSDSAITLTGTDAADEFTVGSAANQVAVEGITFTNVDVVAADAATGDKGESDIVNATAIDVYLTGNDKELSTNGMLFKEIETGNVTDKRLFGSATKSDSITILAANEITANAMGFIGISELDLGAGGGSVTGVDGADWQLTATNKQVISSGITFSNADILAAQNANLVGVAGRKEEFTLEDNSGIEVAVNEMTFTGIDRITDNGSDTDPADSLVSNLSSSDWSLTATDNQVTHSGITITGIESLSGGKKTLNGHVDAVNGDSGDSYTLASNGDVTVDRMTFATMEKIVAAGGSDTVEASGVSGISLLGSQSFSAAVTNGTTSTIIVEGIEKVTDTGEITGTSEADSFTVVKLNDDVVVQSQNIDFYGVNKVDGGDDSDTLTGLADTDFTLSDNSGGFSHSAIDFVNLENVTATGSSQLVGTTQQETYSVQSDGSVKVNGVNFAALSGVSAHADGLTGLDDIVDATLYSAGLALTGNVKEVKLLTTPDTNFVFSGIGQAQTQILDVSASGDVAIVAGDNALDIASINFTSLEEVNGGGSNTLKVAADVSLNNSSTAGDFDSSKMLFSGFNTVNSDSAITLTGTDAADEFTVGSAANQVAVEGITFTNVDVVAADAATGDKGESDIVNATAIDVYLTGNDKELSTNGMLFKEIETGNVTDKRLFGSATKSDSITILAANEITANAMGFIGISELDLGAGGGSVTGVDGADWQLTATNKQVISSGITFSNADILAAQNANLVGVAGRKEEFTLEDNSGIEVAVNEMTFTGIDRITDNGSDTDPADSLVSNLSSSDWSLTATDNQVTHSGITITGIESLSGGKKTLNGHVDAVNGDSGDSYTLASNGDVTVDRMTFATMEKIVAAGGSDTVEASGVSGISLLGSQSFSAAVTNGTTSTIIVEGIEKVTDTGEITGTSEADSFTVVKLNDDVVVQSQNIDFYGVNKVDGGDDSDTLTGLADTDFTLSDNSGGFSHSAIDFVNLENVTATGSSQLVGTTQQETYSVQSDGSVKVNGVNFAALSGVSAHADGLTGLDDIVDATLYSAGLALTGNVKEVKLLTTPDTNFVFSGIGQAQTQILDVSASGDVAIVAGDNALDIASINFTSLEEVNGGGSNTLKVAADVSLNNSSTAGDFDSSKMLFSGFNTVNSDSAITLTGTDAADEFTVGSAANQVAVEGITFTNVDVVAADAATGDKGESDKVIALGIDIYLAGRSQEFTASAIDFSGFEQVETESLFGTNSADHFTMEDPGVGATGGAVSIYGMTISGIKSLDAGDGVDSVESRNGIGYEINAGLVSHDGIQFSNVESFSGSFAELLSLGSNDDEFTVDSSGNVLISGLEFRNLSSVDAGTGDNSVDAKAYTAGLALTENSGEVSLFNDVLVFKKIKEVEVDKLFGTNNIDLFSLNSDSDNPILTASGIDFSGLSSVDGLAGEDTLTVDDAVLDGDKINGITFINLGDVASKKVTISSDQSGNFYIYDGYVISDQDSDHGSGNEYKFTGVEHVDTNGFATTVTGYSGENWYVLGDKSAKNYGVSFYDVTNLIAKNGGGLIGESAGAAYTIGTESGQTVVSVRQMSFHNLSHLTASEVADDTVTSGVASNWQLTQSDNQVVHAGLTIKNVESLSGGNGSLSSSESDNYAFNADADTVTVDGMVFANLSSIAASGSADRVSGGANQGWSLTGVEDQVLHNGITITGAESLSGGNGSLSSSESDNYAFNADADTVTVDGMVFANLSSIAASGSADRVSGGANHGWSLTGVEDQVMHNGITITGAESLSGGNGSLSSSESDNYAFNADADTVTVDGMVFANLSSIAASGSADRVSGGANHGWSLTDVEDQVMHNGITITGAESLSGGNGSLSSSESDNYAFNADADTVTVDGMVFANLSSIAASGSADRVSGGANHGWSLTGVEDQVLHNGITITGAESLSGGNGSLSSSESDNYAFNADADTVTVDGMVFANLSSIAASGSADRVSGGANHGWSLTDVEDQVMHNGITITGAESLSGGNGSLSSSESDNYAFNADADTVTVDGMVFANLSSIAASGSADRVSGGANHGWSLTGVEDQVLHNGITITGAESLSGGNGSLSSSESDNYAFNADADTVTVDGMVFANLSSIAASGSADRVSGGANHGWSLTDVEDQVMHNGITITGAESLSGGNGSLSSSESDNYAFNADADTVTVDGMVFANLSSIAASGSADRVSGGANHGWSLTGVEDQVMHNGITITGAESLSGGNGSLSSSESDNYAFNADADTVTVDGMVFANLSSIAASGSADRVSGGANHGWSLTDVEDQVMHNGITITGAESLSGGNGSLSSSESDNYAFNADADTVTVDGMVFANLSSIAASGSVDRVSGGANHGWSLTDVEDQVMHNGITITGAESLSGGNGSLSSSESDNYAFNADADTVTVDGMVFANLSSIAASGSADRVSGGANHGWSLTDVEDQVMHNGITITGAESLSGGNGSLSSSESDNYAFNADADTVTVDGMVFANLSSIAASGSADRVSGGANHGWSLTDVEDQVMHNGITITGAESLSGGNGSLSSSESDNYAFNADADTVTVDGMVFANLSSIAASGSADRVSGGANHGWSLTDVEDQVMHNGITITGAESLSGGNGSLSSSESDNYAFNADADTVTVDGMVFANLSSIAASGSADRVSGGANHGWSLTDVEDQVMHNGITITGAESLSGGNGSLSSSESDNYAFNADADTVTVDGMVFANLSSIAASGSADRVSGGANHGWSLTDVEDQVMHNGITITGAESLSGGNGSLSSSESDNYAFNADADTVTVDGMVFANLSSIAASGSADRVSGGANQGWSLTGVEDQVLHNGITITGAESLSGGNGSLSSSESDNYAFNADADTVTVDGMVFANLSSIAASGSADRVSGGANHGWSLTGVEDQVMHNGITITGAESLSGGNGSLSSSESDNYAFNADADTVTVDGMVFANLSSIAASGSADRVSGGANHGWSLTDVEDQVMHNGITITGAESLSGGNGSLSSSESDNYAFNADADTVTVDGMVFANLSSIAASGSADRVSGGANHGWSLTGVEDQVLHNGITITGAESLSGGNGSLSSSESDNYAFNADADTVTVDGMVFANLSSIAASGSADRVSGGANHGWSLTGVEDQVMHNGITITGAESLSGGNGSLSSSESDNYAFNADADTVTVDGMVFANLSSIAASSSADRVSGGANHGWSLTDVEDQVMHNGITITGAESLSGGNGSLSSSESDNYAFNADADTVTVDGMVFANLSSIAASGSADRVSGGANHGWSLTGVEDQVLHNGITITGAESLSGGNGSLSSSESDNYAFNADADTVTVDGMVFANLSSIAASGSADRVSGGANHGWSLTDVEDQVMHNGITITGAESLSGGNGSLSSSESDNYAFNADADTVTVDGMVFANLSSIAASGSADRVSGGANHGWSLTDVEDQVMHNGITITGAESLSGGNGSLSSSESDNYAFNADADTVTVDGMVFANLSSIAASGSADRVSGGANHGWSLTGVEDQVMHNGITITGAESLSGGNGSLSSSESDNYAFNADADTVTVDGMVFANLSSIAASGSADRVSGGANHGWSLTDVEDQVMHNGITITGAESLSGGNGSLSSSESDNYAFNADADTVTVDGMVFANLSSIAASGSVDRVSGGANHGWSLTDVEDQVMHNGITITGAESLSGGNGSLSSSESDNYAFNADADTVTVDGMVFANLSSIAASGSADRVSGGANHGWVLTDTANRVQHGNTVITGGELFRGGSGNLEGGDFVDTFILAASNGATSVQVDDMTFTEVNTVNAGGGSDTITATSGIDGEAWVLGSGSGSLAVAGVDFEGVEKVTADDVALDAATNDQVDTFELAEIGTSLKARGIEFSSVASVAAGSGGEDKIESDAGSWQLTGTANALEANGVEFSGIDAVETKNAQLYGTEASDVLTLTQSGIDTAGIAFTGITKVNSEGGADKLVGTSGDDTFTLASNGDITSAGILFTGLESVDTGEGEDTVNAAGSGASWTSSSNGSSLENGAAQARVNGLTVLFDNLEMVQGVGTYIGQDIGSNYVFDSLNSMEVAGVTFADLESLSAGSANDTIQGANIDAVWDINDAQSTVSGNNKKLVFSGIEAINAGSGQDTFNLNGGELASIDTGAGNDTVILSATTIDSISLGEGDDYVEVNENSSDTVALSGGSGSDSFQYNLAGDTWQVKSSGNKVGNFSFSDFEFLDNTSSNLTLETDFAFDFENGGVNSGSFNKSGVGLRFVGSGMRLGYDGSGDINVLSSATGTIGGSLKAKRADLVVSGDVNIESDVDVLAISTSGPDVDITVLAKDNLLIDEINAGRGNVQLASEGFGMLTAETYGDTHITAGNITLGTDTQLWSIIGSELVPLRMDALTNVAIVSVSYYEPEFIGQVPNFTSKGDELQSIAGAQASQGLRSAIQNGVEDFTQVDPAIFSAVKPYSSGVDAVNSPEMRLRSGELLPAAGLSGTDEEDPEFDARLEESQDVTVDYREQETLASINSGG